GYDYIGNASLKAEKSLQAEANLSYSGTIFRFSVTGYYHRLYDYILGTVKGEYPAFTIGSMGVKEYTNINSAFITGADASAGFTLKQGLQSVNTLGYAYGRLSGGSPVPLLSPLRGINSLGYGIKGWHIQAEGDWALAKNSVNTEIGETATAGYFLLNLRTGYKFVIHNHVLAIKFSVENVLDTKYREYADWGNVYRPGRNYVVYISYAFDKTLGCCVSKAKP
ncbi:MAG TPA: TonB-dependent receptor, partial [Chitinophagales bacterium]|nr:TonB-dependent receptor [Chitinophagales bacterium]